MHTRSLEKWSHRHVFLVKRHGMYERRTWMVVGITATMMIAKIVAGLRMAPLSGLTGLLPHGEVGASARKTADLLEEPRSSNLRHRLSVNPGLPPSGSVGSSTRIDVYSLGAAGTLPGLFLHSFKPPLAGHDLR